VTPRELLAAGAKELGMVLSVDQVNSFFKYFAELVKWNKKINLTTIREERDIVVKHGLDSLAYIKGFVPSPGLTLIDLGSGAGFPALPIKIVHPGLSVALVESVQKKASFLRHMIRMLMLDKVQVVDKRTDLLPAPFLAAFDIVTARAFADMGSALLTGLPFLKPGGLMVMSRGPEETLRERDIAGAGATLKNRIELTLPHSNYKRAIWVFKKNG
jgi:16S rRNA (guanine527-N7)-methyltransferase